MEFNNCSNSSNISGSVEEYLRHLQDKTNITMIPAVTMLIIFAVTGLIGNTLVLVVYSQKFQLNPTKILIMTIACFDLVANVAAIPSEMNIMLDSWDFRNPGVCKSKVFLGSFTTVGGAISLLIVAYVRYRKVCRPYGWQVTIRQAIIASVVTSGISLLFAIPYVIIYGIRTRKTPCPYIRGTECFADDQYFHTIWPLLNNLLFILLFLFLSVSMVVLYILIGVTAWKHSKLPGESSQGVKVKSADNSISDDHPMSHGSLNSNLITNEQVECGRIKSLLCCTGQQRKKTKEDTTHSSFTMKTLTTDTETGEEIQESMEVDLDSASALDLNVSLELDVRHLSTVEYLAIPESSTNSTTRADGKMPHKIEEDTSRNGRHSRGSYIIENVSSNEQSEDNPEPENEVQTKDLQEQTRSASNNINTTTPPPGKTEIRRKRLGRMTAMLIIISAIFVVGYFPFLILTIYKNRLPENYAALTMVDLSFYNLFYRLYFLNSAANPFVYSLCDLSFRRQCLRLLTCRSKR